MREQQVTMKSILNSVATGKKANVRDRQRSEQAKSKSIAKRNRKKEALDKEALSNLLG